MSNYERIAYYYGKGWASLTQMQQYVVYGVITAVEYETITGQAYQASA